MRGGMAEGDQTATERIARYRQKADAATASAERAQDPRVREAFLSLAQSWQRLADDVETMERLRSSGEPVQPSSSS